VAGDLVDGIQRATFGPVPTDAVDDWLRRHVRTRLGTDLDAVELRSGRVSAVFGLRLVDGQRVVVKVHRGQLDAGRTASLAAAVEAQRLLARAGYPCPAPLDGPAVTAGLTATTETWLDGGAPGNAHRAPVRRALARSLAEQVELLRSLPTHHRDALRHPPAWAVHQHGPWPAPHDPIFDFTTTPPEHAWIDDVARRASAVINRRDAPLTERVVGHSDWYCGNVRFSRAPQDDDERGEVRVVSAWDWDSVVAETEAVLAGMAAASFTDSGTSGPQAPTPREAAAFLADLDAARERPFTGDEQVTAAAMVAWTLAYNARCLVDVAAMGFAVPEGSTLDALAEDADAHLALRW
jgi:hypothetical protein